MNPRRCFHSALFIQLQNAIKEFAQQRLKELENRRTNGFEQPVAAAVAVAVTSERQSSRSPSLLLPPDSGSAVAVRGGTNLDTFVSPVSLQPPVVINGPRPLQRAAADAERRQMALSATISTVADVVDETLVTSGSRSGSGRCGNGFLQRLVKNGSKRSASSSTSKCRVHSVKESDMSHKRGIFQNFNS
jgi:hypothetical protein